MARIRKQLRHLVQARSGDKGNTINIAVFAPGEAMFELLKRELTSERVKSHFAGMIEGEVTRYVVPNLLAMNYVCRTALGGGGSATLRMDNLGKCYAANLLRLEIEMDDDGEAEEAEEEGVACDELRLNGRAGDDSGFDS